MKKIITVLLLILSCGIFISCKSDSNSNDSNLTGIDTSGLNLNSFREFLPSDCQIEEYADSQQVMLYRNQKDPLYLVELPSSCKNPVDMKKLVPNDKTPTVKLTKLEEIKYSISSPDNVKEKINWCMADSSYKIGGDVSNFCNKYLEIQRNNKNLTEEGEQFFYVNAGRMFIVPPFGRTFNDGSVTLRTSSDYYNGRKIPRFAYDITAALITNDTTGLSVVFLRINSISERGRNNTNLTTVLPYSYEFYIQK